MERSASANIKAMMKLIETALKATDADGRKKQKVSYMSYWTTFCAAYGVDGEANGRELPEDRTARLLTIQKEMATLAGFAGYVVIFPRRKGKARNNVAHSERAVGVVRAYHRGRNGRTPGTAAEASFDNYVKEALRGLSKIYPTEPLRRSPLLADHMRAVRGKDGLKRPKRSHFMGLVGSAVAGSPERKQHLKGGRGKAKCLR